MATVKRESETLNYESSQKKMKESLAFIPDDIVENIFAFLPIREAVKASLVSTRFINSWRQARFLNFGRKFLEDIGRYRCPEIFNYVIDLHEGPKIDSLILDLDPTGMEFCVESWIKKSTRKNLEDLQIDFNQGNRFVKLSLDFSAIETLRILRLCLCDFVMPKSPKGLKFLHTLALRHTVVTSGTIHSVFSNCFHLKHLELIECRALYKLKISARNQKNFEFLAIGCCDNLKCIILDAPSLETFRYGGSTGYLQFVNVQNLKYLALSYVKNKNLIQPFKVLETVFDIIHTSVLTATSVFLEGMTKRIVEGVFKEMTCRFWNLQEFQLNMKSPSFCNLFDIANFLKNCPNLKRFFMDINYFTFECGLYWEAHQRQLVEKFPYKLNSLKFVEIMGFKCHSHEMDIVKFFLHKAPYLQTVVLVTPSNNKTRSYYPDYGKIYHLMQISPNVQICVYEDAGYISPFPLKHDKRQV